MSRRYDLEPLRRLSRLSKSELQRRLGVSGQLWGRYWVEGVSWKVADRCAGRCGFHPAEVWPEWVDEAIRAAMKPCAACGVLFLPHRRTVLYCGQRCRRLIQQRRYRERPDVAERNRQNRRAAYAETSEYERARQRRYYAENREEIMARRRRNRPSGTIPSGTLHVETSGPGAARTAPDPPEPSEGSEMAESTHAASTDEAEAA